MGSNNVIVLADWLFLAQKEKKKCLAQAIKTHQDTHLELS